MDKKSRIEQLIKKSAQTASIAAVAVAVAGLPAYASTCAGNCAGACSGKAHVSKSCKGGVAAPCKAKNPCKAKASCAGK